MTVKELQNEIKSLLNNQDDTFKENVKKLAKDTFNTSSLSRMKKAELQQYYQMLVEMIKEEEQEEEATTIQTVQSVNVNVIKQAIQITLKAMNKTLDNAEWSKLHQRYLHLKSELERLDSG